MIRAVELRDAEPLASIYNYFIEQTFITFEEECVATTEMSRRIQGVSRAHPWLVELDGDTVSGYAYATSWQARSAYRYTVETTIYCNPDRVGRGIGTRLYSALIDSLRSRQFHCAIGGIALPNDASVALHEKLGFRKIAEFAEVGFKFGRWINVGYWELML